MIIRNATAKDCTAIAAILNDEIRNRLATFKSHERSAEDMATELADKAARALPFLVATGAQGQVLGYGTYGQFRAGEGYIYAMEHTVMLAPEAQGQGAGRALMAALEDHGRTHGVHVMVAAVSAANTAGVQFHTAIGYETVGRMPQVGHKMGQWLDLVLMQKLL